MRWETKENIVSGVMVVVLIAVATGISALYGTLVYGNWKCGLPIAKCRIEVGR